MKRVIINWGAQGTGTFKCDATRIHESGRALLLFKVRSQDPDAMRVLVETKIIPLGNVLEVDESEW